MHFFRPSHCVCRDEVPKPVRDEVLGSVEALKEISREKVVTENRCTRLSNKPFSKWHLNSQRKGTFVLIIEQKMFDQLVQPGM